MCDKTITAKFKELAYTKLVKPVLLYGLNTVAWSK